jgi:hypothetical protein
MLYGRQEDVDDLVQKALYTAMFFAWDVSKPSPANTEAQGYLVTLADQILKSFPMKVTPSELPLHGCPNIPKYVTNTIELVVLAYGKPVLEKKQNTLKTVFKAQLELAFNSVPKFKKDLVKKYPELFPSKRGKK